MENGAESREKNVGLLILLMGLLGFAWASGDSLNLSSVAVRGGDLAAMLRLAVCALPMGFGLVILCLAERLSMRVRNWCLVIAAGCLAIPALEILFCSLDPDEPIHVVFSYQISQGLVPYRDFFTIRHLLLHLVFSPVTLLMQDDLRILWVARFLMLFFTLGTLTIASRIVKWAGGDPVAAFLFLPTSACFVWGSIEFRGDPLVTALCLASLLLLLKGRPVVGGILLGVAFLTLQKTVLYGFSIGLGCLLGGVPRNHLLKYTASCTAVSLLYFVWAAGLGIWNDYFTSAFRCSSRFSHTYVESAAWWYNHLTLSIIQEFTAVPLIWIAAIWGCVVMLRAGTPARSLPCLSLISLALLLFLNLGWKNYMLFSLSMVGILAAVGWSNLPRREGTLGGVASDIVALLAVTLGLLQWAGTPPPGRDLSRAALILERLPKKERVYSEDHLAHPLFRVNASYYGNAQERYSEMFGDIAPHGDPGNLELLLVSAPPGAVVIPNPERLSLALSLLATKGYRYAEASPGVYLRTVPPIGSLP